MSLLSWLRGDNEVEKSKEAEEHMPNLLNQASLSNQRLSEACCQSPNTAADYLPKNFSLYDAQNEGAANIAKSQAGPDNVAQTGPDNVAAGPTNIAKHTSKTSAGVERGIAIPGAQNQASPYSQMGIMG